MKYIIIGTNRRKSRSRQVGSLVQKIYRDLGEEVGMIDLAEIPLHALTGEQYGQELEPALAGPVAQVTGASGLIFIVPEYNGSLPGALKYFIDHWKYPETFEHRPVCMIGLGGMFGGLRPVEHLQQIMGYRNAFVFPQRIFLQNVWNVLKDGQINDALINSLLIKQAQDFQKFTQALETAGLDANTLNRMRTASKA
jgi:NAD(P)H-dependent FMN reductase